MTIALTHAARRKVVMAGIAGNVMEWYDFAIYGYFARTIGRLYFPSEHQTASLIAAFGVFAVGFLMRPLGAILFGHIGDRVGRGPALIWSVVAMAVPTFGIGVLPTYDDIGISASLLMILCRILQGLAVGGEYTGSAVFLAETAAEGKRGFASAWAPFGAVAGILLGSAVGTVSLNALPLEDIAAWGWRLPFLFGVVVGGVAFVLRRRMEFDKPAASKGFPLAHALSGHGRQLVQVLGLSLINAATFYLSFVYIVTWLKLYAGLKAALALQINTVNMALMLVVILASAWLSDRIGRRPILVAASLGLTLLSWPLFMLMLTGSIWAIFLGQFGFTLLVGAYGGVIPITMCEMFPKAVRCSAVSTAYNLTVGLAGGTAPMVATWLIDRTGYNLTPSIYMTLCAVVSAFAALSLSHGQGRVLEGSGAALAAIATSADHAG